MNLPYTLPHLRVTFKHWTCTLEYGRYLRGGRNIAITLNDVTDGQRVITATVNAPEDLTLPDDLVMIKDWTENEGIVEVLQAAGVIGREQREGFMYPTFALLKRPSAMPGR